MSARVDEVLRGPPQAVVFVLGKQALLVDRAVDALVAAASAGGADRTVVRADEPEALGALGGARTLAMFARRRVVVMHDVDKASDALMAALCAYTRAPAEGTSLIVGGAGLPAVRKGGKSWPHELKKALDGTGVQIRFDDDDADPVAFVRQAARAAGHELSLADARLLVDLTGKDLARLEREVEKLSLLVAERAPITAAEIHDACALVAEPVVWNLTTGIAARRPGQALAALHHLEENGESAVRLIALILWQLRLVLRLADALRRGVPEQEAARELKLRTDVVSAVRREVERGMPGAAVWLGRLADAHREMHTVRAGSFRVLEVLVLELATR